MALLPGTTTVEGTRTFRDRAVRTKGLPESHFRIAPGGLMLASFGLGTYLGEPDSETDLAVEQAVGLCLRSERTNVIDTAINYRFQKADRAIGRAVARVIEAGAVRREEIFLATKN
ncbi:MAG: aldo/keto reductase, partial [Thermoplasmata archaeon]|nr:aldo/keto reductase [Thermoplasmata archaeon]